MSTSEHIIAKIDSIQTIFQNVTEQFKNLNDVSETVLFVEKLDAEFRSIGYESLSMAIAIKDLEENGSIQNWKSFASQIGAAHATQVYVGLGWAIARIRKVPSEFTHDLEPLLRFRVLDGCGYCDAVFSRRRVLQAKLVPDHLLTEEHDPYNQGVGRRLWYLATGDVDKLTELLNGFPKERHHSLWRGVGIAVGYVGGFDDQLLNRLLAVSDEFQKQLIAGGALAIRARSHASALNQFSELLCSIWCNTSVDNLTKNIEHLADSNSNYHEWISGLESKLFIES